MQKILAFIGIILGTIVALFLSRNRDNHNRRVERDIGRVDECKRINSEIGDGIDRAQDATGDAGQAIDRARGIIDAIKKRNGIVDK